MIEELLGHARLDTTQIYTAVSIAQLREVHAHVSPKGKVAMTGQVCTLQPMNALLSRITVDAGKCGGRPCIRGYRLRVKDVLELLAHGASWPEILADYPFLEEDDIRACLEFAAAQNDHVVLRAS